MEKKGKLSENDLNLKIALIVKDVEYIKNSVAKIETSIAESYITRAEFAPVRSIVYGLVSLILVAVVTALVTLVLGGTQ